MDFSETQIERYARHIVLREIGGKGQARLLDSAVLVIGAGGLGSPLLMYLAAAGVGTLGVVDDDQVSLSNLQRQVIHTTGSVGRAKTESARDAIAQLNPEVRIVPHEARLAADNVNALISDYEVIADSTAGVVVAGTRAEELALRLKYADFRVEPTVVHRAGAALDAALAGTPAGETLYVVPTYTAMLEVRALLARRGRRRPFWEER